MNDRLRVVKGVCGNNLPHYLLQTVFSTPVNSVPCYQLFRCYNEEKVDPTSVSFEQHSARVTQNACFQCSAKGIKEKT